MKKLMVMLLTCILLVVPALAEVDLSGAQEKSSLKKVKNAVGNVVNPSVFSYIKIKPERLNLSYYAEEEDYTVVSSPYTFQYGDYLISRATVGTFYKEATPNVFCYENKNGELVAAVISQKCYTTNSMKGVYSQTKNCVFNAFFKLTKGETKKETKKIYAEGGRNDGELAVIFLSDEVKSMSELPFKTCDDFFEKLPNDILSDKERANNLYTKAEAFDFGGIIKECEKYISSNNINENDNVLEILEIAKESKELAKKCKIKYDKFQERYTISYSDLKDVGKTISICTYFDGTVVSKIGFRTSNWIFFDTVEIAGEGMNTIRLYFGNTTKRDASGSGVKEYALYNFNIQEAEQMKNGKNLEIRFSGDYSDKKLERKLSKKEVEAIYTLLKIKENRNRLTNIMYPFK